jgi:hypothetical protein
MARRWGVATGTCAPRSRQMTICRACRYPQGTVHIPGRWDGGGPGGRTAGDCQARRGGLLAGDAKPAFRRRTDSERCSNDRIAAGAGGRSDRGRLTELRSAQKCCGPPRETGIGFHARVDRTEASGEGMIRQPSVPRKGPKDSRRTPFDLPHTFLNLRGVRCVSFGFPCADQRRPPVGFIRGFGKNERLLHRNSLEFSEWLAPG